MLDFGALPPEINSGRMYTGAGSGPMLAAAAAWDGLAAELSSTASGYGSVVSELTNSPWLGPASRSMVASATPYIAWLSAVAGLAEQAGVQARAAAAAYETAFVMTVPPPVIAANRMLLMALIATNFFGQNTPAMAATEAQYAEMWAQDATAMYGYAGSSAAASQLSPFTAPAKSADQSGLVAQSAAVANAAATPAGAGGQTASSATSDLISASAVPQLLQQLSSSVSTLSGELKSHPIVQLLGSIPANQRTAIARTLGLSYFGLGIPQFFGSIGQQLTFGAGTTAGSGGAWYSTPQFASFSLGGSGQASASLASANRIGLMSVPPTWSASPGSMEQSAAQAAAVNYVSSSSPNGAGGLLRGLPMGGGGRRAAAGFTHRYGFRQNVITRPPSAG
ncbi:hypothetical protein B586_11975 [Mycobacterium haemophilum DSM 44634]|nr:PPE family protein [Mycobacterium haemophilum]AKN18692.1 hypothetical protein B586_11975 [Mycobacterium haemophilum DSM 44634]